MRNAYIHTRHGTTFTYANKVVPTISTNGEVEERYVNELKPNDKVLFRGVQSDITFDDILSALYQIDGYKTAREFVFIGDSEGYETTRLRYDILRSLAKQRPDLFEREELAHLDNYIFRHIVNGEIKEFSRKTATRVLDYLELQLSAEDIHHRRETYQNWINGETIHPQDFEDAEILGIIIGSGDLYSRANQIRTLPPNENPYLKLVNTHRITAAILANIKPLTESESRRTSKVRERRGRVFEDIPEWYLPTIESLRPRIQEQVVEDTVLKVELTQEPTQERTQTDTKISKGVIVFPDETYTKHIYEKLHISPPRSRRTLLINRLQEAKGTTAEILKNILPHYSDLNRNSLDAHPIEIESPYGQLLIPSGSSMWFEWISPVYNYSANRIDQTISQLTQRILSRLIRGDLNDVRSWSLTAPPNTLVYKNWARIYNDSLLLRSLFTEHEYVDGMTSKFRQADVTSLMNIFEKLEENRLDVKSFQIKSREIHTNLWGRFRRRLNEDIIFQRRLEELRKLDLELPIELSSLRSLMSYLLDRHILLQNGKPLMYLQMPTGNIHPMILRSTFPQKEIKVITTLAEGYDIEPEYLLRQIEEPFATLWLKIISKN